MSEHPTAVFAAWHPSDPVYVCGWCGERCDRLGDGDHRRCEIVGQRLSAALTLLQEIKADALALLQEIKADLVASEDDAWARTLIAKIDALLSPKGGV